MRSSTRKADRVRVSVLALGLTLAACTAGTGAAPVTVVGDHGLDAGENHRAKAFMVEDHTLDHVEAVKAGATD